MLVLPTSQKLSKTTQIDSKVNILKIVRNAIDAASKLLFLFKLWFHGNIKSGFQCQIVHKRKSNCSGNLTEKKIAKFGAICQTRPQGLLGSLEKALANSRSRDLKLASHKARCRLETVKISNSFGDT